MSAQADSAGAFAGHWRAVLAHSIAPIPVNAAEKRPLVRWSGRRPFSATTLERLAQQFPDAGLGILTGRSGVAVVDIDAPDTLLRQRLIERCGQPGAIARTPRGGWHLYYAGGTERTVSRTVPGFEGEPVDVRAAGGLLLAPPTVGPAGAYRWECGSFDSRATWPGIREGALQPAESLATGRLLAVAALPVPEGRRTKFLYDAARDLLHHATLPPTLDWLAAELRDLSAARCAPPAPDRDVMDAAWGAWKGYQRNGGSIAPSGVLFEKPPRSSVVVYLPEVESASGDAQTLYRFLRQPRGRAHAGFVVNVEGIRRVLKGRKARWTAALRELEARGTLVKVRAAGPYKPGRKRDPALWAFRDSYGLESGCNLIRVPARRVEAAPYGA